MTPAQKAALNKECDKLEWPHGVGPKLKQMLRRGVGVHHAGLLPKYRRVVEDLFEKKLLSVALCTETLAAGINLPARSVVVTSLVKGPFGKEKLIDPSSAHQIFGRAGRPQYDTEGFVFAYPHEDDVRILRWKQQFDQIPENTKDPALLKKRKDLNRKKPARNSQKKYWTEADFERLKNASPARLYSKGPLPWRLLAYLLKVSPDVEKIRSVVRKRLLDQPRVEAGMKQLNRMLITLHEKGFVVLEPAPPAQEPGVGSQESEKQSTAVNIIDATPRGPTAPSAAINLPPDYQPITATPTPALDKLLVFRACHPLYGAFLLDLMAIADRDERVQLLESVLELPKPLLEVRPRSLRSDSGSAPDREARPGTHREGTDHRQGAAGRGRGGGRRGVRAVGRAAAGAGREGPHALRRLLPRGERLHDAGRLGRGRDPATTATSTPTSRPRT